MTTPPSHPGAERTDGSSVRIGALVPLTRPGWVGAGQHLLAGIELAVREVNTAGGIAGRPLELVVRDTAADPQRAAAAVEELAGLGVAALAGEYHSVVARAAATRADALGLPFLCSSAVLDALTEQPTQWVARHSPPQSRGWQVYADFLLAAGHSRIAVAAQPSVYWAAGTRILRDHLAPRGATVTELDMSAFDATAISDATAVCDELVDNRATVLLLLVGHPEPAVSIVKSVRRDQRLAEIMIGAPAGQPEFTEWATLLGDDSAAVPFLRYLPERLTPLGVRVGTALREQLAEAPPSSPSRATTRSPYSPMCCVPTAWTGRRAPPTPGRASQSKAPAGRSGSPACQASACGNGPGRRSRSSTEIRRTPAASGSCTPAESARSSDCLTRNTRIRTGVSANGPHGATRACQGWMHPARWLFALLQGIRSVQNTCVRFVVDVVEPGSATSFPTTVQEKSS